MSYAPPPREHQRVEVLIDGRLATVWKVGPSLWTPYEVEVPLEAGPGRKVELEFRFPDARSPMQDDPKNPDDRVLGMGVRDTRRVFPESFKREAVDRVATSGTAFLWHWPICGN